MNLPELQQEVDAWASRNFPTDTRETVVLGLAEETGELCRAALKRFQGIRGTQDEWYEEVRKEAGDIFLKLLHIASTWDFDLEEAVLERWETIKQRDFVKDPKGHGLPSN